MLIQALGDSWQAFPIRGTPYVEYIALLAIMVRFRSDVGTEHRQLIMFSAIGMGCFGIGVLVSCLKAGLAQRFQKDFNRVAIDVQLLFQAMEYQDDPEIQADRVEHH